MPWGPSTLEAPLCPPLRGFFSVKAVFTGKLYHQKRVLSSGRYGRSGQKKAPQEGKELRAAGLGDALPGGRGGQVFFGALEGVDHRAVALPVDGGATAI